MAHILPCISKGTIVPSLSTCKQIRLIQTSLRPGSLGRNIKSKTSVQCCSVSPTSAAATEQVLLDNTTNPGTDKQLLVSELGWNVRRLVNDEFEMREVAQLQAEAFHIPMPLFDDLFFQFFKAEVLSGLLYKLRNSPPDRYACLVAEPAADSSTSERKLVGIVDVTVFRDETVLQHLGGGRRVPLHIAISWNNTRMSRFALTLSLKTECMVTSERWKIIGLMKNPVNPPLGRWRPQIFYTKIFDNSAICARIESFSFSSFPKLLLVVSFISAILVTTSSSGK